MRARACARPSAYSPTGRGASSAPRRSAVPAAPLMRAIGKRPADKNPNVCNSCFDYMEKHHGGAEIEVSFLFADIRGSTTLAEGMSTAAFRALIDRFYSVAARTSCSTTTAASTSSSATRSSPSSFLCSSGPHHAAAAVGAATDLLRATGHADRRRSMGTCGSGRRDRPGLGRRGRRRAARPT